MPFCSSCAGNIDVQLREQTDKCVKTHRNMELVLAQINSVMFWNLQLPTLGMIVDKLNRLLHNFSRAVQY